MGIQEQSLEEKAPSQRRAPEEATPIGTQNQPPTEKTLEKPSEKDTSSGLFAKEKPSWKDIVLIWPTIIECPRSRN